MYFFDAFPVELDKQSTDVQVDFSKTGQIRVNADGPGGTNLADLGLSVEADVAGLKVYACRAPSKAERDRNPGVNHHIQWSLT
jgi:hypothetical protein